MHFGIILKMRRPGIIMPWQRKCWKKILRAVEVEKMSKTRNRNKPIRKTAKKESRNLKKEKEKMKIGEEIQMKIPRNNPKIRMRTGNLIQNLEKEIPSHSSLSRVSFLLNR